MSAQTKKGKVTKGKAKEVVQDSTATVEEEEETDPFVLLEASLELETELDAMTGKVIKHPEIKRKNDSLRKELKDKLKKEKLTFRAWTQRPNPKAKKPEKTKLCINIVYKDTNVIHRVNDTICVDPEVTKLLLEKLIGDTLYQYIYIDAFNKSSDPLCASGHETKLYFVKWNVKTMKTKWKHKTIASCTKGITNMTKSSIKDWDKSAPLEIKYNRSFDFTEILIDPAKPQAGFQMIRDDSKEKDD
jgi:hypothetical protein